MSGRRAGLDRSSVPSAVTSSAIVAPRDVGVDQPTAFVRVPGGLTRLRAERLVDGAEQRVADADVHEEAHRPEHRRP